MAINLTAKDLQKRFKLISQDWKSFEEFEEYYIRSLREKLPDTIYYVDKKGKAITFSPINHHPELQEYEVWMEGHRATGESSQAQLLGRVMARNFGQACHIIVAGSFLQQVDKINQPGYLGHTEPGRWDYDAQELSIWRCKLYWSEELARKSFG
jgi:hypothetical protein